MLHELAYTPHAGDRSLMGYNSHRRNLWSPASVLTPAGVSAMGFSIAD
ncbi:hypothetical protein ACFQ4C_12925 [Larkinella insperata]|uniref:Uncharacterized protein n=1 Tax=Larkinella insperata TaxID=332158 RepID=A0ABW3QB97_9BACT|nr:hypothetical protein [Larkinella insperata]